MDKIIEINSAVNGFVWGPIMLALLVGTGIYLSFRVGFIQFSKIGYWWKNTIGKIFQKSEAGEGEITPMQAVSTALASTVGTGNIAGVTGAIILGGPGAVFWMWISALFGMVTKFAEVTLAVKYRERNEKGDWCGGPMYYIKNGLGPKWKWLGVIFSVFGALAAFGIGNISQINSIASSVNSVAVAFHENAKEFDMKARPRHGGHLHCLRARGRYRQRGHDPRRVCQHLPGRVQPLCRRRRRGGRDHEARHYQGRRPRRLLQ